MGLFRKKEQINNSSFVDISITYDINTNTYIITTYNEKRKVRVLKSNDNNLIIDTCYKKQGRPKSNV